MPPILKRLRKPSEAKSPDLATLLEPYGASEGEGSADPGVANGPEAATQDDES